MPQLNNDPGLSKPLAHFRYDQTAVRKTMTAALPRQWIHRVVPYLYLPYICSSLFEGDRAWVGESYIPVSALW